MSIKNSRGSFMRSSDSVADILYRYKYSLDYLDPGYSTNGNLTISSNNKFNDNDATSNFSTSHR